MNSLETTSLPHHAVLVLPRIRVQNANAISSPMTWGFPAITAFTGAMTALERRLGRDAGVALWGVGVICHGFEAQVTTRRLHQGLPPQPQPGTARRQHRRHRGRRPCAPGDHAWFSTSG